MLHAICRFFITSPLKRIPAIKPTLLVSHKPLMGLLGPSLIIRCMLSCEVFHFNHMGFVSLICVVVLVSVLFCRLCVMMVTNAVNFVKFFPVIFWFFLHHFVEFLFTLCILFVFDNLLDSSILLKLQLFVSNWFMIWSPFSFVFRNLLTYVHFVVCVPSRHDINALMVIVCQVEGGAAACGACHPSWYDRVLEHWLLSVVQVSADAVIWRIKVVAFSFDNLRVGWSYFLAVEKIVRIIGSEEVARHLEASIRH